MRSSPMTGEINAEEQEAEDATFKRLVEELDRHQVPLLPKPFEAAGWGASLPKKASVGFQRLGKEAARCGIRKQQRFNRTIHSEASPQKKGATVGLRAHLRVATLFLLDV